MIIECITTFYLLGVLVSVKSETCSHPVIRPLYSGDGIVIRMDQPATIRIRNMDDSDTDKAPGNIGGSDDSANTQAKK